MLVAQFMWLIMSFVLQSSRPFLAAAKLFMFYQPFSALSHTSLTHTGTAGEQQGDEAVILTDILGLEDALGTMDFKVAGNETGISAFQLDIKSEGLTLGVLDKALAQVRCIQCILLFVLLQVHGINLFVVLGVRLRLL